MQCPRCQHENPPQAKFCLECGTRMTLACSKCRAELPPSAKFCLECGERVAVGAAADSRFASPEIHIPKHLAERIITSKAALEGERKHVTVLFADLKGSMELLADRDPEEARKILDPVLTHMVDAVHRYEGTVNQVMGDGIMALFGAPIAHEDHAVRACYAALRMQEMIKRYADEARRAHGAVVNIRVGLNSGEVVVRAIGSDLHMDYTAVGQTTNLAARMEQLARPGTILITPETLALAEGYVEVKSLGRLPVKGVAEPLEVYEMLGASTVRSRFHAATIRGLTKFVGRSTEMEQLCQALDHAKTGRGQVVAVVGEPGVGKSRLYYEFLQSHHMQGCLVIQSASVSYGKAAAYLPVIEFLKVYFRIEGRDDARTIREKVTGRLLSLDRALEPFLAAFQWLLDISVDDSTWERLDPPQRRHRTLDGVKRLVMRESQVQPVVLLFEDLHWIDSETQVLLDGIVEGIPSARVLLLVNYRPEYQHAWGSKTYYRQLRIDPLSAATAHEFLDALLGDDSSVQPLKALLVQRTEGIPFFLEESVRTLSETKALIGERGAYRLARPVEAVEVPETVKAILAARLDRLEPAEKAVLQAASVIGMDVPFALLQEIGEVSDEGLRRHLAHLQAAEFLYETRLFPDVEYTFKHALTHEVAYGGLLQERRRDLHARIVTAIETLYADRLGEHIERLAHHALRGELRQKAVDYLQQAGAKAATRSAQRDAQAWFEQALGVLEALPATSTTLEQAFEIRLALRSVLHQLGEARQALARLHEAERFAERLKDDRRRGRVYAFKTASHAHIGELDEAFASGTRALEIAAAQRDRELRILTTSLLEHAYYYKGEYERVVLLATENLSALSNDQLYEDFGNVMPPALFDRAWLLLSLAELGRFDRAAEVEAEAIRLAGSTQHALTVGFTFFGAGSSHLHKGDWAKARSRIDRGIAVMRTGNILVVLAVSIPASAWVLAQLDDPGEAWNRVREGEELLKRLAGSGHVSNIGWGYYSLGHACLLLGRVDEAQRLGDRAVEYAPCHPGFAAHASHLLGDISSGSDRVDVEGAEAHYRRALALAEPRGMRPLMAHCHLGLGKVYRRMGRRVESEEHLTTAAAMYREMGMGFYLAQAEEALKEPGPRAGR